MDKNSVANVLEDVASLLELKEGSNPFEVRAYENAARAVSALDGDIEQLTREGKLKGVPGLGSTIIKRIEELVNTGQMALHDELVAETPQVKLDMRRIQGVGPKKINVIYNQLHVQSIAELEQACKENKVAVLPGFGKKTQDKILQGIALLAQHAGRFLDIRRDPSRLSRLLRRAHQSRWRFGARQRARTRRAMGSPRAARLYPLRRARKPRGRR